MKNRNSLLSCLAVLVMTVFLGINATAASARVFSDVPNNHWAERYIARISLMGIAQGYDDGSFGISKPINRLEVVTMIIRTMGLESQAEGKSIPLSFQDPGQIPSWARGYVAMAVIQGVISGDDLVSFRGEELAKRYEVAAFIGKAMGLESSAPNHRTDVLPFSDSADIPSSARGYVSLLNKNGVMMGNADGTFRPRENVTRGEIAVLMTRLDDQLEKFPEKEVRGTVSQVTNSTITIKTDGGYETLTVGDDCLIFQGGKNAELKDILLSDPITAVKNGFKALLLDSGTSEPAAGETTSNRNTGGIISGVVVSVNYDPDLSITIEDDQEESTSFPISDSCEIEKDGSDASIKDILPGDKVEMKISDSQVTQLSAQVVDGKAQGTVEQILIKNKVLLTIVDDYDKEHTYQVNRDIVIKRDGDTVTLMEIKAGDYVDLRLESNIVTRIYAESRTIKEQISGKVTKVNTDLNLLVISTDNPDLAEKYTVIVDDGTNIITVEGAVSSRLSRVKTGDRVTIVGDADDNVIDAGTILVIGSGTE